MPSIILATTARNRLLKAQYGQCHFQSSTYTRVGRGRQCSLQACCQQYEPPSSASCLVQQHKPPLPPPNCSAAQAWCQPVHPFPQCGCAVLNKCKVCIWGINFRSYCMDALQLGTHTVHIPALCCQHGAMAHQWLAVVVMHCIACAVLQHGTGGFGSRSDTIYTVSRVSGAYPRAVCKLTVGAHDYCVCHHNYYCISNACGHGHCHNCSRITAAEACQEQDLLHARLLAPAAPGPGYWAHSTAPITCQFTVKPVLPVSLDGRGHLHTTPGTVLFVAASSTLEVCLTQSLSCVWCGRSSGGNAV